MRSVVFSTSASFYIG
uniref:Uncharacterized protein n=1 Tax=Anguilla anguilla TaxID=7936 RepID=A0A0E9TF92_ANGAN